jgi:PAS domain S-box-containing protein
MVTEDDGADWLTSELRADCGDVLKALFSLGHACIVAFDVEGRITSINDYALAFGGSLPARYKGVSLLEHRVLQRLGWSDVIRRVLDNERVELTESRWVTLFGNEERYVDVSAGPILHEERVVGGVAVLVDATARHRAQAALEAKTRQMREVARFLARDVGTPLGVLVAWAKSGAADEAQAKVAVDDVVSQLEDVRALLDVATFVPKAKRVRLLDVLRGARVKEPTQRSSGAPPAELFVEVDERLLRRAVQIITRLSTRMGAGGWSLETRPGRVAVIFEVGGSQALLSALLDATALSTAESASGDASLAAAKWMLELMDCRLTAGDGQLTIDLPTAAAEDQSAVARVP